MTFCTEPDGRRDGPRERLLLRGEQALSDAELLAVLLGTGSTRESASVLAERVLEHNGGLSGLQRAGMAGLQQWPGIGAIKACRLRAALELGIRLSTRPLDPGRPILSSCDVDAALRPHGGGVDLVFRRTRDQ